MDNIMECGNCGIEMQVIERNPQSLAVGYRCLSCGEELWPYDVELPPEAFMVTEDDPGSEDDDGEYFDGICPRCHGTGHDWDMPCTYCDGMGRLW